MKKTVLIYGVAGGLLIAALKAVEYRFLVVDYSLEIYGGIVAAIFAALGIWLGLKLTRRNTPATPFVVDAERPARGHVVPWLRHHLGRA